jgi:hypothetical protein
MGQLLADAVLYARAVILAFSVDDLFGYLLILWLMRA